MDRVSSGALIMTYFYRSMLTWMSSPDNIPVGSPLCSVDAVLKADLSGTSGFPAATSR